MQQRSVQQAQLNFEQTKERFNIGRVTSLEFRTAQNNLLSVAAEYNNARFNAKVAEFQILQLTGKLFTSEDHSASAK